MGTPYPPGRRVPSRAVAPAVHRAGRGRHPAQPPQALRLLAAGPGWSRWPVDDHRQPPPQLAVEAARAARSQATSRSSVGQPAQHRGLARRELRPAPPRARSSSSVGGPLRRHQAQRRRRRRGNRRPQRARQQVAEDRRGVGEGVHRGRRVVDARRQGTHGDVDDLAQAVGDVPVRPALEVQRTAPRPGPPAVAAVDRGPRPRPASGGDRDARDDGVADPDGRARRPRRPRRPPRRRRCSSTSTRNPLPAAGRDPRTDRQPRRRVPRPRSGPAARARRSIRASSWTSRSDRLHPQQRGPGGPRNSTSATTLPRVSR